MKRYLAPIALILGLSVAWAVAQTYTGQAQPTALLCAHNTVVPTPTAGQFYYIQCNSSGRIIIQ